MLSRFLSLWLVLVYQCTEGLRIPIHSQKLPSTNPQLQNGISKALAGQDCGAQCILGDISDSVYTSTISIGGRDYIVQLDTGSSDLWINATAKPVPNANLSSSLATSVSYLDGSSFAGPIGLAEVQVAGYSVANQSYLNAETAVNGSHSSLGVDGLIGLSFRNLSRIQAVTRQATGSPDAGQPFLYNLFASNMTLPNFISFVLNRNIDSNATAPDGVFTVSEFEEGYEDINDNNAISVFPPGKNEWAVLLDAMIMNGKPMVLPSSAETAIPVPPSKLVALLDTGTATIRAPTSLVNAIYSKIPGAHAISLGNTDAQFWVIPCQGGSTVPSLSFSIGGQIIPVHPLDMSLLFSVYRNKTDGSTVGVCLGGLVGEDQKDVDVILGVPFLKNVYTMFNFGTATPPSSTPNPFVKLLALTDPTAAALDFNVTRSAQLGTTLSATPQQITQILAGSAGITWLSGQVLAGLAITPGSQNSLISNSTTALNTPTVSAVTSSPVETSTPRKQVSGARTDRALYTRWLVTSISMVALLSC